MSTLLNCKNDDILDMFPRIKNLGASSFGEDADLFGDTLAEAIEDAPQGRLKMRRRGVVCRSSYKQSTN
ncbi:hypothetical protein S101468_02454 [Acetobacter pasteurianus subsp. pasteurianus]|uniref:Uncharacterized protein n=1 Tax=Acetobacter pasteurianus subsp. pasteurianus TaxID=481145 RepID=A0AAC9STZ8_ACEPA|nr:hypothetical protein [Acetobacter pasteurianus]ASC06664.1 hypothetical protein S101468_02454 [Acetobacter pasteurianus subsp. pasteurianus]